MIQINRRAIASYTKDLTDAVSSCINSGMNSVKENIHVDTGRNRESVRQSELYLKGTMPTIDLIVGGIELRGVFSEQDIIKEVDYSLEEEIRHPIVRESFVPAVDEAVKRLKFD